MKIIKKYTAILVNTKTKDDELKIKLSYGNIDGPFYSRNYPDEEFDTEDEAIESAYKIDKYGKWLILPVIRFDNY